MYPQFYFITNPQSQLDLVISKFMKKYNENELIQNHRKQLTQFYTDKKYIDSPLSNQGYNNLNILKKKINEIQSFDTVIVGPLKKNLQTAYELFKDSKTIRQSQSIQNQDQNQKTRIKIFIQPLLNDRLNSTHTIGNSYQADIHKQDYERYKTFFENTHVIQKINWLSQILPQRVINQLPKNIVINSSQDYLQLFQNFSSYEQSQKFTLESRKEFNQRLQKLKNSLLQYKKTSGQGKKVLIIAGNQTLNILGSTGYHQNGKPVNSLKMKHGEIQNVSIVKQGKKSLGFDLNLPFCS